MNPYRIFFIIGIFLSAGVGIWHFFVPSIYKWHKYIPDVPKWLWVAINWCNIFFSISLTGLSIILLIFQREVFNKEIVAISFYSLLLFIWFSRVIITIFYNWGHDLVWKFQLIVPISIFLILFLPLFDILAA
ncbi:hypothetical protein JK636_18835 [Clostridium sp. YIM B02515]|uniref:DUF1761 domain-containing protein n=1 Tax=Clostridium rhizosphaerae TaxID=2803861 RepID=A0ABS1TEP8_9CLOT|nr:hypothetical protein [Clostridium rhizosphaerae]MBL4937765.1 hypothetical protein [Clostridium rhizosphaerae]